MTLILFGLGWLAGLWLADYWGLSLHVGIGCLLISMILLWNLRRWHISALGVVLLGVSLGMIRMILVDPQLDQSHIKQFAQHKVSIEGVIADEPRWTPESQRFTLETSYVKSNQQTTPTHGLVLVELAPEPARQRGERIVISGTLLEPERGQTFNYAEYLARRNVYVLMQSATLVRATPPPSSLYQTILNFKQTTQRLILRLLPEPQASLAVGILLGIQSSVPEAMWSDFNRTGTSHILVISGWNISIIVVTLLAIAQKFGWSLKVGVGVALGLVVIYVFLVGATPSVLRAAIMGSIVACAPVVKRRSDAWTALITACVVMTLLNPQVLWDLGFQLSALATASLFAWSKRVEKVIRWLIRWRWLNWMIEPLTATLAAQIWALPIILYTFGNLSLIAPLANVLMVPIVPLAMGAGAALVSLGLIWRASAIVLLPLAWLSLSWLTWVAHYLAATEWAAVALPPFPVQWMLWAYLGSLVLWWWLSQRATLSGDGGVETGLQPSPRSVPSQTTALQ